MLIEFVAAIGRSKLAPAAWPFDDIDRVASSLRRDPVSISIMKGRATFRKHGSLSASESDDTEPEFSRDFVGV